MSDRSLIFNAEGVQIGYIEADRAFDLTGRERCKYARATGNLSELNSEKIVGHVSLDGTFAGLSWISDELFGKPSDKVNPSRIIRNQRPRYRPKKANTPRHSGVKEPRDVTPPTAKARQGAAPAPSPQPENAVEGSRPFARSEKAADEAAGRHREAAVSPPDQTKPTAENEVLGRAIGMIRSALEKGAE